VARRGEKNCPPEKNVLRGNKQGESGSATYTNQGQWGGKRKGNGKGGGHDEVPGGEGGEKRKRGGKKNSAASEEIKGGRPKAALENIGWTCPQQLRS